MKIFRTALGPVNTNLIMPAGVIFVASSALASCVALTTMIPIVEGAWSDVQLFYMNDEQRGWRQK